MDAVITVAKDAPEIESSQMTDVKQTTIQRRFANLIRLTKTVEVIAFATTTVYSPLVVQKTVSLAGAPALKCLPIGYQVCIEQ